MIESGEWTTQPYPVRTLLPGRPAGTLLLPERNNQTLIHAYPACQSEIVRLSPSGGNGNDWANASTAFTAASPRQADTDAPISRAIASTSDLTAATLRSKAARSASLKVNSMIRSTPPAPKTTGTPT